MFACSFCPSHFGQFCESCQTEKHVRLSLKYVQSSKFYAKVMWFVKTQCSPCSGWDGTIVKARDLRCRRLEQGEEDGSVSEVVDKDNRWWNWKGGVKGGGEIRFFSVMLLSGRGCGCQSILAASRTKSPGLPPSVTHKTHTCSVLPTSAAQCDVQCQDWEWGDGEWEGNLKRLC